MTEEQIKIIMGMVAYIKENTNGNPKYTENTLKYGDLLVTYGGGFGAIIRHEILEK